MEIKQYEVIVNEKNATCGFVVNLSDYPIEEFLKKNSLKYEVYPKDYKVRVFTTESVEQDAIWFVNLSDELIYYVYKTIDLTLLGGIENSSEQDPEKRAQILVASQATLI